MTGTHVGEADGLHGGTEGQTWKSHGAGRKEAQIGSPSLMYPGPAQESSPFPFSFLFTPRKHPSIALSFFNNTDCFCVTISEILENKLSGRKIPFGSWF